MENEKKINFKIWISAFLFSNVLIWSFVYAGEMPKNPELDFLSVGQGDSSLVMLPGSGGARVKILIDAGPPNFLAQKNLEKILPVNDRYIDLIAISHPQLDHFGGLIELLKNYKVGAVLSSGLEGNQLAWQELKRIIKEKNIKEIIVENNDRIRYKDFIFNVFLPKQPAYEKEVNDAGIVFLFSGKNMKAFFGADIGTKKEKELARLYDIDVDVLKVSHHGSKYSSDSKFLKEATPAIAVIGVGKNSYGHPTREALGRLASVGSQIFRTDTDGLVRVVVDNGKLEVFTEK